MISVSNEWKEKIREGFRDRGYMRVALGYIPSPARIDQMEFRYPTCQSENTDPDGYFTYYSNDKVFYKNYSPEYQYATLEYGYTRVDGSMKFLPREAEADFVFDAGLVSENLMGAGTYLQFGIKTASNEDLKGLRIKFGGNYYPENFDIDAYRRWDDPVASPYKHIEVRNNESAEWFTDEFLTQKDWDNTPSLVLTFKDGSNVNSRVRIESITIGDGILFGNDDIVEASYDTSFSDLFSDIPQNELEVQIKNRGNYDIESPDFDTRIHENQTVDVYCGFQLSENIEWIKITTGLVIEEIGTNRSEITLNAVDVFRTINNIYRIGRFTNLTQEVHPTVYSEILGYVLGEVLPYSRITYRGDSQTGLNRQSYNPLPVVKGKEAIQLIGNMTDTMLNFWKEGFYDVTEGWYEYLIVHYRKLTTEVDDNFRMRKNDMLGYPSVNKKRKPSQIQVKIHKYDVDVSQGSPTVNLGTITFEHDGDTTDFELKNPYPAVRLDTENQQVRIASGYPGVKWVKLKAYADNATAEVIGIGTMTETVYTKTLVLSEEDGEIIEWDNPLIHTDEEADEMLTRLAKYYTENTDYEYDTRGFPEIEVGDVIYQDNPYVENMKVRVVENSFVFDGTFNGHMKVRRITDDVDTAED